MEEEEETTYQPVIAVFATALLMALAASWASLGEIVTWRSLEWFVAIAMCILAILKLRDLEAFSNQFLGYDLLAQRVVRYAYVYPFAEAFAGRAPDFTVLGFHPSFFAIIALFWIPRALA